MKNDNLSGKIVAVALMLFSMILLCQENQTSLVIKKGEQCQIKPDCSFGKELTIEVKNNITKSSLVAIVDQTGYDAFFTKNSISKDSAFFLQGINLKSKGKKEKKTFKCDEGIVYVLCMEGEITVKIKYK